MLGYNMFAYCQNNPANYFDPSGNAAVVVCHADESTPFGGGLGFLGIGGSGGVGCAVGTVVGIVGALLVDKLVDLISDTGTTSPVVENTSNQKEDTVAIVDTVVASSNNGATYYGADIKGGKWKLVTSGMSYEQAIAWIGSVAASNIYGKNASWGVYTYSQQDAAALVLALGGTGPCLHENRIGEYPHYHPTGMILYGKYKHFHVWFGDIYE